MANSLDDNKILKTVKKTVAESVQGVLRDPDYGMDLKESYQKKLQKISDKPTAKGRSLKAIKSKYAK